MKVYCGANKEAPKNARFGDFKECAEKRQLRRYGRIKMPEDYEPPKATRKAKKQSYPELPPSPRKPTVGSKKQPKTKAIRKATTVKSSLKPLKKSSKLKELDVEYPELPLSPKAKKQRPKLDDVLRDSVIIPSHLNKLPKKLYPSLPESPRVYRDLLKEIEDSRNEAERTNKLNKLKAIIAELDAEKAKIKRHIPQQRRDEPKVTEHTIFKLKPDNMSINEMKQHNNKYLDKQKLLYERLNKYLLLIHNFLPKLTTKQTDDFINITDELSNLYKNSFIFTNDDIMLSYVSEILFNTASSLINFMRYVKQPDIQDYPNLYKRVDKILSYYINHLSNIPKLYNNIPKNIKNKYLHNQSSQQTAPATDQNASKIKAIRKITTTKSSLKPIKPSSKLDELIEEIEAQPELKEIGIKSYLSKEHELVMISGSMLNDVESNPIRQNIENYKQTIDDIYKFFTTHIVKLNIKKRAEIEDVIKLVTFMIESYTDHLDTIKPLSMKKGGLRDTVKILELFVHHYTKLLNKLSSAINPKAKK
jgi:hypothetical protein